MANNPNQLKPNNNQTPSTLKPFRESLSMTFKSAFSVNKEIASKLSLMQKETRIQFFLVNIMVALSLTAFFVFLYMQDIVNKETPLVMAIVLVIVALLYVREYQSENRTSYSYEDAPERTKLTPPVRHKPLTATQEEEPEEQQEYVEQEEPHVEQEHYEQQESNNVEVEEDDEEEVVDYTEIEEDDEEDYEEDEGELVLPMETQLEPLTENNLNTLPDLPPMPSAPPPAPVMETYEQPSLTEQSELKKVEESNETPVRPTRPTPVSTTPAEPPAPKPIVKPTRSTVDKVAMAEDIGMITPQQASEINKLEDEVNQEPLTEQPKALVGKKTNKFDNMF